MAWSDKKKVTRRERFLAEMNAVMPWAEVRALIAPHYPTTHGGPGRPAMPLEAMRLKKNCVMISDWQADIVMPYGERLIAELEVRCNQTGRAPSEWLRVFRLLTSEQRR